MISRVFSIEPVGMVFISLKTNVLIRVATTARRHRRPPTRAQQIFMLLPLFSADKTFFGVRAHYREVDKWYQCSACMLQKTEFTKQQQILQQP